MKNSSINKITVILTRIIEISHIVAAILMAAAGICAAFAPGFTKYFIDIDSLAKEKVIEIYGFEAVLNIGPEGINFSVFAIFAVGAVIIMLIMAMIFHNLYIIMKKTECHAYFSEDTIKRLRQTGILSMAIPAVGLIMSVFIRLIAGVEYAELSVNMDGVFMGLVVRGSSFMVMSLKRIWRDFYNIWEK